MSLNIKVMVFNLHDFITDAGFRQTDDAEAATGNIL